MDERNRQVNENFNISILIDVHFLKKCRIEWCFNLNSKYFYFWTTLKYLVIKISDFPSYALE